MPKFLKSSALMAASILILLQGVLLRSAVRPESIPSSEPLSALPGTLGGWRLVQEGVVDEDTMSVLRADDVLNRTYAAGSSAVNLFVAAFRSQRNGKAPHSPKNCLPGSGWAPVSSGGYSIDLGEAAPISVNKYVVAYGDQRSVVLYWYQSRDRVIADEYAAKFWVVIDAMRLNRTDTALVRVVVPVVNHDEDAATRTAADFVRSLYTPLRRHLPA